MFPHHQWVWVRWFPLHDGFTVQKQQQINYHGKSRNQITHETAAGQRHIFWITIWIRCAKRVIPFAPIECCRMEIMCCAVWHAVASIRQFHSNSWVDVFRLSTKISYAERRRWIENSRVLTRRLGTSNAYRQIGCISFGLSYCSFSFFFNERKFSEGNVNVSTATLCSPTKWGGKKPKDVRRETWDEQHIN